MYQLSTRQILLIALLTAVFTAAIILGVRRFGDRLQPGGRAFTEAPPAGVTDPAAASDEQNNVEVYRALSPGVVFITSTASGRDMFDPGERQGTGSGSVIDTQGHVLTNYHVVEGARKLTVSFGGGKAYPAKVVGGDPDTDLAVLKVEAPPEQLTVVPFGDSDSLAVGQKVLAIGNPFGLDRTLTTVVISGLQRPIRARNGRPIEGAIQTDASINPGNSGGPLLDSRGRMIGINSQILSPDGGGSVGVGFAVPVNIARRVVPQLIQNGRVARPRLGVGTRDVKGISEQAGLPVSEGAIVIHVIPGSAAARAGLRGLTQTEGGDIVLGDIITAVDGEVVAGTDGLYRILDRRRVGDVIRVEVYRGGERVTVPVRLTEAPEAPPHELPR